MKKGYTLIELMIVVVLMGLIYGLVTNVFQRYKDKAIDVTLLSLEKYMMSFHHNNHVSLVCIKGCQECLLHIDGKFKQNVTPFIKKDVEAYHYDKDIGIRELTFIPYFDSDIEEDVCFRYEIRPNGSRTEMIPRTGMMFMISRLILALFANTVPSTKQLNSAMNLRKKWVNNDLFL